MLYACFKKCKCSIEFAEFSLPEVVFYGPRAIADLLMFDRLWTGG